MARPQPVRTEHIQVLRISRLLLSLKAPAGGAIRKCQNDTVAVPRKHLRNVEPGVEELPHHTGGHGHVEGPRLRRRGIAAVTPGRPPASAAIAQRTAAPRIRLQATGNPLRPGMR